MERSKIECGNLDELAKILYEEYVKERSYSVIDRLSRVTHKETAVQVLYDLIRGLKNEEDKKKFKDFIEMIENKLNEGDFYCIKLLALKALGYG